MMLMTMMMMIPNIIPMIRKNEKEKNVDGHVGADDDNDEDNENEDNDHGDQEDDIDDGGGGVEDGDGDHIHNDEHTCWC